MTDVGFVIAGWGVILGGLALYAAILVRRLRTAREASLRIRRQADGVASVSEPDAEA